MQPSFVTAISNNDGKFDTGAVTLTPDEGWQLVGCLQIRAKIVSLRGVVGDGGFLGNLMLTQAAVANGPHDPLAEGTDFAEASASIPVIVTSQGGFGVPTAMLFSGQSFQLNIDTLGAELAIWAQAANAVTTLQVTGSVWPPYMRD